MRSILHIIDQGTPGDMLDHLRLLRAGDDTIASVGPAPRYGEPKDNVIRVHRFMNSARMCGWSMREMGNQVEVVHSWSTDAQLAGRGISFARGVRHLRSLPCIPDRRELRSLIKFMNKHRLHVTVPTAAARRTLISKGAPQHTLHVLPPPAGPVDDIPARRARVRETIGISDEEMLLVAPTEMIRGGGHKYASWAHAIVRQVLPKVRLLFPGTGPNEHNVRSFAGSTGFDEEVFLTGDQFGKEDVLAGADVAVFFHETDCGVSALVSAMCAGVPIAACDTPDISECAPHEDSSLLGRAKDPRSISAIVLRLLEDPALRKRLIKSGRRRAEMHFRPELSRRRLDEIYDALLSDRVHIDFGGIK